jgi:hypothetical protein
MLLVAIYSLKKHFGTILNVLSIGQNSFKPRFILDLLQVYFQFEIKIIIIQIK